MNIKIYYPIIILTLAIAFYILISTLFYFHPQGVGIERAKEVLIVDSTEISGRLYYIYPYSGIIYFRLEQPPIYHIKLF